MLEIRTEKDEVGVVRVGCPVLRRVAEPVDPALIGTRMFRDVVEEMLRCLIRAPGVGVAAPQIGVGLRIIVVEDGPALWKKGNIPESSLRLLERTELPRQVVVNPTLEPLGDETVEFLEGCLSVGPLSGAVRRHRSVRVRGLDERGEPFVADHVGWPARIFQHEVDHLEGTLFLDRMDPRTACHHTVRNTVWDELSQPDLIAALRGAR